VPDAAQKVKANQNLPVTAVEERKAFKTLWFFGKKVNAL
jgi:hypothetical protein